MARRRASGSLDANQLAAVADASLANAVSLIGEAETLLTNGAMSRAYSLAILAAEEFGKCQLAVGTVGRQAAGPEYWKEWWSVFYGHDQKLARAAFLASNVLPPDLIDEFVSLFEAALRERRRESGFYVDVVQGAVLPPNAAIASEEAQHAVELFSTVIRGYSERFEAIGLVQAFVNANEGPAREMRAAIESGDSVRIAATWEATTGRRLDEHELADIMQVLLGDPARE